MRRTLRTLIRSGLYKLSRKYLKLPFKLKLRWKSGNRWKGKQGRLEIVYDDLDGQWWAYMPVELCIKIRDIRNSINWWNI